MGLGLLTWSELLLRGGLGGVGFILLFLAARWRWKERVGSDAQTDLGLD